MGKFLQNLEFLSRNLRIKCFQLEVGNWSRGPYSHNYETSSFLAQYRYVATSVSSSRRQWASGRGAG